MLLQTAVISLFCLISLVFYLVFKVLAGGLEPPRALAHCPLKTACLPVPPRQLKKSTIHRDSARFAPAVPPQGVVVAAFVFVHPSESVPQEEKVRLSAAASDAE